MALRGVCIVDGCDKQARRRGWCYMHYSRWKKNGDPEKAQRPANGVPLQYLKDVAANHVGPECLPWPYSVDRRGYGKVWVGKKCMTASRVICELVNGPAPSPNLDAAHSCGKGHLGCVSPSHISWKTKVENAFDRVVHGTSPRGTRQGSAKLTSDDIIEIRRLSDTMADREIAAKFGICREHVGLIRRRKSWSWLN